MANIQSWNYSPGSHATDGEHGAMNILIEQTTSTNDFHADLKFSNEASTMDFWDQIYKKAFVDMDHTEICTDKHWQHQGVDKVVYLTNGHTYHIDEKTRRRVWPDIALEYISNDTTGTSGWMEKDLNLDYLAYAFMPIQTVYLFPWPILRRTWKHYKDQWFELARSKEKNGYSIIKAPNDGYTTWSVGVPIKTLRDKEHTATIIQLEGPVQ